MQIHRRALYALNTMSVRSHVNGSGCKLIPQWGHSLTAREKEESVYFTHGILRIAVRNWAPGPKFLAHICM